MKQHTLAAALCAALSLSLVSVASVAAQPDPERMIIKFKPGGRDNAINAARGLGGQVLLELGPQGAFAARIPAQALAALRNNPNIEYVELDAPRYPMGQVTPYGVTNVQAPQAVAADADGTGIKVCVIDSGIKSDHEDFAGIAMTGYPAGWNNDSCGHGTHVAGTIAAANNSTGVIGVSPGKVSLHIIKVFDGASCGWSYASGLADAANRCAAAGAKVINMSLGGSTSSTTESNTFASLNSQGILSIAAAGNDGNNRHSYPASYSSVMSVAAVDVNNVRADFSQYTNQVEISAPGVGVLSTYPTRDGAVTVGTSTYMASAMEGSPQLVRSGGLVDGGRCTAAGAWSGKVVLCERGDISFSDKVLNAQAGGAAAAIVYNNVAGGFGGTLNGAATSIPSVSMSQEDGQALVGSSATATVSAVAETNVSGYAYLDGTSMATPHVAGVAALVWSADPTATNTEVRNALTSTALDLQTAGRDNYTGYGLVQAFDATEALLGGGSEPPPSGAPTSLVVTNNGVTKGKRNFGLSWSGGTSTVDVFRGTSRIKAGIANTGSTTDSVKTGSTGSFTYKVCNAGSSTACVSYTVNW
jgi:serine protease